MSQQAEILLVTWDGAGNLAPERALVRGLIARGHRVRALAHDSVRETLERDRVECLPLRGAQPYDSKQPKPASEEMSFVVDHIWYARPFGEELLAAVERIRPDLLLVDVSLTYAMVAAQRTGLPTAVLVHFPYDLSLGAFAGLFASRLEETNAYAAELGLPPFPSHRALTEAAALVLVASYQGFDRLEARPPNLVHVGPCRSGDEGHDRWQRRAPGRPLVLVGLSTSHQHQLPLLQRLCDALGRLEVEALITTGAAIRPEELQAADNTTVTDFIAHDRVLPAADLLITHAGHGTVMAGATYGVPMLCFPMGRDQPMNAARVAELGIGAMADPEASVAEIERKIASTLADATIGARARAFAAALADHRGLDDAVRLVESLLTTGSR